MDARLATDIVGAAGWNMDLVTLLSALTGSGLVSLAVAKSLAGKLLDHRLDKDLKLYDEKIDKRLAEHKADLDTRVAEATALKEGAVRKEVEGYLGDQSADREYRSEARKRLYLAVGPLRFQLLNAASEAANRVLRVGDGLETDLSLNEYFGRSTAYRVLRVLALGELVERQIAYADFSVDPDMRSLLRFKRLAMACFSSSRVSLGHSQEDWNEQKQHVFQDNLGSLASLLIIPEKPSSPSRVMRFSEFNAAFVTSVHLSRLEPIPRLFASFSPKSAPILWLRLLALMHLCAGLVEAQGAQLGLEAINMDVDALLKLSADAEITKRMDEYKQMLEGFRREVGPST
ncbi:hypothetical protein [Pinirhizobacter soli]|uniref:hypothetical protein n=1 Tax=Pinirhizobacter soli TaxID=2786953 RepID=UPI002029E0B8|nr:hypothetical protein [Pinirhizobacter soli]